MNRKIYFVSDAHLGSLAYTNDTYREKKLVAWLDAIKHDAAAIYLVGDIFDFLVRIQICDTEGFVRLFGKIAEPDCDSGIPIHFFIGNHDIWTYGYLEKN